MRGQNTAHYAQGGSVRSYAHRASRRSGQCPSRDWPRNRRLGREQPEQASSVSVDHGAVSDQSAGCTCARGRRGRPSARYRSSRCANEGTVLEPNGREDEEQPDNRALYVRTIFDRANSPLVLGEIGDFPTTITSSAAEVTAIASPRRGATMRVAKMRPICSGRPGPRARRSGYGVADTPG